MIQASRDEKPNSAFPASDYDGRVVKTLSPLKTHRNHLPGDTSLVDAGMDLNPI